MLGMLSGWVTHDLYVISAITVCCHDSKHYTLFIKASVAYILHKAVKHKIKA